MEESKITWNEANAFVKDVIQQTKHQAKMWMIAFIITLFALVGTNVYWIYQFTSYEYVSQDGNGINSVNTGNQENINFGSEGED